MADNEIWKLDLDTKEFVDKLSKVKDLVGKVGDEKMVSGLVEGLGAAATAAGVLAAAGLALKVALDLTQEAEHIRAVNTQFEMLTKNAGLATDTLIKGLKDAAGGLVDDTELMELANKSLVRMGGNAERLPQIMEAARKVTAVYGGELTQNFDTMSDAISRGNTRMLKQFGIIVDNDKAIKEYAKSHGLATNELSEHAKQAALMEAVLKNTEKNFKGVNTNIETSTKLITEMKVVWGQFYEAIAVAFEKFLGPAVRGTLKFLKDLSAELKNNVLSKWGDGAEKSSAQVEVLQGKLEKLNKIKSNLQSDLDQYEQKGFFGKLFAMGPENVQKQLDFVNKQIANSEKQIEDLTKKSEAVGGKPEAGGESKEAQTEAVDQDKRKENYKKFQQDLLKIKQDQLESEFRLVTSMGQAEALLGQEKAMRENQYSIQRQAILQADYLNEMMKKTELNELDKRHKEEMLVREQELAQRRLELMEQVYQNEKMGMSKVTAHARLNFMQMQNGLQNYKKQSVNVFQVFDASANSAMDSFAEGSANASQAAKGFFFGFLGDVATKHGKLMLLQAIWPPNPVAAAGGIALLALGRILKGAAGGKGGGGGGDVGTPSASAGGGESGGGGGDYSSAMPLQTTQQAEIQRKSVTISIQGSYFETEQTKTKLMEMMREATDATDFAYKQIGSR